MGLTGDLAGDGLTVCFSTADQHYSRAHSRQTFRGSAADSAVGPGHDTNPAGHIWRHLRERLLEMRREPLGGGVEHGVELGRAGAPRMSGPEGVAAALNGK